MDFLTTPLAFVVVLGIIIFVHEFGHLITAKAFGMRVFVFSFGFGKRLAGFKWGDTDCRVSLIPLGGYVKLEGEPGDHLSEDTQSLGDGRDFLSRPRWQRFLVYMAGPIMNLVLTVTVFSGLYLVGYAEPEILSQPAVIGAVDPGSPAAAAGIEPGDEIRAIDDQPQENWGAAFYGIVIRPDATVRVRVRRGGEDKDVVVRSASTPVEKAGTIGVHPLTYAQEIVKGSPAEAAGLQSGDGILYVGDSSIRGADDVRPAVIASGGKPIVVKTYRNGALIDRTITPRNDGTGPKIGVQVGGKMVVHRYGPLGAVSAATRRTAEMTRQIFEVLGRLVTGRLSPKTMAGPLGIAQQSGEAVRQGWPYFWGFVAFISVNVGVLNLFPLAPLDGGHLAILAVEGVARRDLSPSVKGWIMNAGAAAIFLLIGLVLYSDFSKVPFVQRLLQ